MNNSAPVEPRVIDWIEVKRNVPLLGRSYGHWWIELHGNESYGWWPNSSPLRLRDVFRGTQGVLNAGNTHPDGIALDPNHGLVGDYQFHPVLLRPSDDEQLVADIRKFSAEFEGAWQWSTRITMNCRLFQLELFDAVGLVDGTGNYHTRGNGCPALARARRVTGKITGTRRWPSNLPTPGPTHGIPSPDRQGEHESHFVHCK